MKAICVLDYKTWIIFLVLVVARSRQMGQEDNIRLSDCLIAAPHKYSFNSVGNESEDLCPMKII